MTASAAPAQRLAILVRTIVSSATLQSTALFAVSGAAFAVGNLCLATTMQTHDYAEFSLLLGIYVVSGHIAPFGIDQLMLRRNIDPGGATLRLLLMLGIPVSILTGLLGVAVYDLPLPITILLGMATMASSLICTAACAMRREGLMVAALMTDTSGNWFLLLIGIAGLAASLTVASATLSFVATALGVMAIAWARLLARHRIAPASRELIFLTEALPLLGISVAGTVLIQTERLVIPLLLPMHDLAVFGILTSIAIAPFRMLASGLGYALTKDLRDAVTSAERRLAIRREMLIGGSALLLSTLCVMIFAPILLHLTTGDRYVIGLPLLAGACLNGIAKATQSLPRAIITAIGSKGDLSLFNAASWAGVIAGLLGAVAGGHVSLNGLMIGAGLGNLAGTVATAALAWQSLQYPKV